MAPTFTFTLASPETGTTYALFVVEPKVPGPWPVVLGMDGDFIFGNRVDLRPVLKAAPVLFVGVGYGARFGDPANQRGRDYTPVAHGDEPSSGGPPGEAGQVAGQALPRVGEKDSASMTGGLALLEQQLAAQPFAGLEIISRRFPKKDHYNVVPEAFATGLAALFAGTKR
ncbi:hypothetical protein [Opitutus sp. GAS368]|uniref:hypothetical protein n=1 Tax=Opitutus sp. GAS368 TaxID=1882749 RepID=UPI00087A09FD|nr:hypothetical protein [Opitutus sp. GAS368]SDS30382.1 hypothetical protein SAMN05444173_2487 [Opitutus sp. GAS368]